MGLSLEVSISMIAVLGVVYVKHAMEVAEPVACSISVLRTSSTELVERCMIS